MPATPPSRSERDGIKLAANLAVVIIARDEAIHIERAIQSVRDIATSVLVVDSGSTDDTVAIAGRLGARTLFHPWKNHADQFQWGVDQLSPDVDWVLRLDADEVIEADLAAHIRKHLSSLPSEVTGVNFDRKHIFMDRWIRHGGRYPLRLLRIFRRGRGRIEQRWMDEHIVVDGGSTVTFPGGFADHNLNDLSYFVDKHNKYATLEAVEVLIHRYGLSSRDEAGQAGSTQTAAKRWIKEKIYNRIPFGLSTLAYFLFRYIVQLGFLDGRPGLIYHFLQGYWYRFLVGAKVAEFDGILKSVPDADKRQELARLTGLKLD